MLGSVGADFSALAVISGRKFRFGLLPAREMTLLSSKRKEGSQRGAIIVLRPSAGFLHQRKPTINLLGMDLPYIPRKSLRRFAEPGLHIENVATGFLLLADVSKELFHQSRNLDRLELDLLAFCEEAFHRFQNTPLSG